MLPDNIEIKGLESIEIVLTIRHKNMSIERHHKIPVDPKKPIPFTTISDATQRAAFHALKFALEQACEG